MLFIQDPTCFVPHALSKARKEKASRENRECCLYSAECIGTQTGPSSWEYTLTIHYINTSAGHRLTETGQVKIEKRPSNSNLQLSTFIVSVPTVAPASCCWLTGVRSCVFFCYCNLSASIFNMLCILPFFSRLVIWFTLTFLSAQTSLAISPLTSLCKKKSQEISNFWKPVHLIPTAKARLQK